MNHEEYKKASEHWKKIDANGVKMDKEKLKAAALAFINSHNTCALATGFNDFVRCTPIEYSFHDGAFYMFSEGGEKFIGLEMNKNVCLAIYEPYNGFGSLKGMQVMGKAEVVEPFSSDYIKAADFKKIPLEALKNLKEPMNLIKVSPVRIDYLDTDFKKSGYSSRQRIDEI